MPRRRDPKRVPTNVRLDLPIVHDLEIQADKAGLALLTYIEVVLAEAHAYSGKYLPELELLPMPLTAEELHAHTSALTAADCVEVTAEHKFQPLKIEQPLLEDHIKARANQLDVPYSAYVRAILRGAAGHTLPGRGEQPVLDDLTMPHRGGAQLRRVS